MSLSDQNFVHPFVILALISFSILSINVDCHPRFVAVSTISILLILESGSPCHTPLFISKYCSSLLFIICAFRPVYVSFINCMKQIWYSLLFERFWRESVIDGIKRFNVVNSGYM